MFVGALSPEFEALSIEALKSTTADEMVSCIVDKLQLPLPLESYELAEVVGNAIGQECKERRLAPHEDPVALMLLWPKLGPPLPPQHPPPPLPSSSAGSSREKHHQQQQQVARGSSMPAKRTTSKWVYLDFFFVFFYLNESFPPPFVCKNQTKKTRFSLTAADSVSSWAPDLDAHSHMKRGMWR